MNARWGQFLYGRHWDQVPVGSRQMPFWNFYGDFSESCSLVYWF
jgi:hypothetical protein